jgi:hypothetical protein
MVWALATKATSRPAKPQPAEKTKVFFILFKIIFILGI